jgi:hypothetical protein
MYRNVFQQIDPHGRFVDGLSVSYLVFFRR